VRGFNPYGGRDSTTVFTIPGSGAVHLFDEEMEIVATPMFQRLAGFRQLGTAHLVFRGATHTRFEHSLGALHEAERIVQAVNGNIASPDVEDSERAIIRLSALLHDVTHIAYGHTLEDEFGLLVRHDENVARKERLFEHGGVDGLVRSALGDDGYEQFVKVGEAIAAHSAVRDELISQLDAPFIADIIGNTVCADMLDYVQRDMAACGMPAALGDRFLDFFTITPRDALDHRDRRRMALNLDKRGMPRPDVESEVLKLLGYRYELVERVYFHHGKNAASVMIARAVHAAGLVHDKSGPDSSDEHFDFLSDEMLLRCMADVRVAAALKMPRRHRRADRRLAAALASGVLEHRLYKIGYMGVYDDIAEHAYDLYDTYRDASARRSLEDRLACLAGLQAGDVLVHLPSPKMLLKLAEVRVMTNQGHVITLEEWDRRHSRRATALQDAHQRLWRLTVYVTPSAGDEQRALVRAASEEEFGAPSRYVKVVKLRPYLKEVFDQTAAGQKWAPEDERAIASAASKRASPISSPAEAVAWMNDVIASRDS
jgi:uncharacterized protein